MKIKSKSTVVNCFVFSHEVLMKLQNKMTKIEPKQNKRKNKQRNRFWFEKGTTFLVFRNGVSFWLETSKSTIMVSRKQSKFSILVSSKR